MKRYIIEVPEEIRSCEQCPCLTLDRLDNWYCPTNENVKCSADVKPEGCPLQETTMKSQAEIEARIKYHDEQIKEHGKNLLGKPIASAHMMKLSECYWVLGK